jgi:hypothetical protein
MLFDASVSPDGLHGARQFVSLPASSLPRIYFGGGFEATNDANKATLLQLDQCFHIGLNIQVRARIICSQVTWTIESLQVRKYAASFFL